MKYILPALALFVFVACGNKDFKAEEVATLEAPAYSKTSGANSYDEATTSNVMDESSRADATIAIKVPTHIIKTASVQFQVKNLDESHQRLGR
jgi:hypothetical protein